MREIPGQESILDVLIEVRHAQEYEDRQTCDHCALTYWAAPSNPLWTLARQAEEHIEMEPGICRRMAEIRDTLTAYETGTTVPEPHWTKRDLSNYIFVLKDLRDHIWRAHHSRQPAG